MINSLEAISRLLQGTLLEAQPLRLLDIDESDQVAVAISVEPARAMAAWQLMKSHLAQTQRYPILTTTWGGVEDWFSRFYYQEEVAAGTLQATAPAAVLAEVSTANLADFLASRRSIMVMPWEVLIADAIAQTHARFGISPEESQIRALIDSGAIASPVDLEKWLFFWELQNGGAGAIAAPDTSYLDWFEPDSVTLLLLPIAHGWESLAYLHWYGACTTGSAIAIRLLQQWHQQYRAELVCHYGTMLQFQVAKPPTSPEQAFDLAWAQVALAECTTMLPGVALRDHGRSLLTLDRWFLHERP